MYFGFYILLGILWIKSQELFEMACCEQSHMLLDPLLFTQKSYKWNSWGGPQGRSIETDFNMKETLQATCSLSQIFSSPPYSSPHDATTPTGPGPPHCQGFTITLRHTTSVGLLWTCDQPVAETSTRQNTTLTRDRHSCSRRDSAVDPSLRSRGHLEDTCLNP